MLRVCDCYIGQCFCVALLSSPASAEAPAADAWLVASDINQCMKGGCQSFVKPSPPRRCCRARCVQDKQQWYFSTFCGTSVCVVYVTIIVARYDVLNGVCPSCILNFVEQDCVRTRHTS